MTTADQSFQECYELVQHYKRTVAAIEAELAAAKRDAARMTYIIERSNLGDRWLTDDVWDQAAALCPVDKDEAEDIQKWVRAVIDAAMGAKDATT